MTAIQWFAFVILPLGLAIVAIVTARLFERAHPMPVAVDPTDFGRSDSMARSIAEFTVAEMHAASQPGIASLQSLELARGHFEKALSALAGTGIARDGSLPNRAVAQHLPFLRRYARALTGNQSAGDACVGATLEAFIKDPGIVDEARGTRVGLYRLFTGICMPADARLANPTPKPRQAFLLVTLEGFSEEDAAKVLDVDVATLRSLVEESGREIATEIGADVLIIEDETFIAMDLESLVEAIGHRVLGIARTHSEARALARKQSPGLVLADIQLADDSSGIDAVNELLATFEIPVIFITAYPERFLTGERTEPTFLIAKPFQPAMVAGIASQALFLARNAKRRKREAAH